MTVRLAIDTATDYGTVAVDRDEMLVGEVRLGPRRQATMLVSAIQWLLETAAAGLSDVKTVVLADGPGSFTGLRVGFATVQGILAEHSAAVRTVPSLMSVAAAAGRGAPGRSVLAVFDALRGQVFAAVYSFRPGAVDTILEPTVLTIGDLRAGGLPDPSIVVGDDLGVHRAALDSWIGDRAVRITGARPSASTMFGLIDLPGAARSVDEMAELVPEYGRAAEAQVRWEQKHGRPLPDSTDRL